MELPEVLLLVFGVSTIVIIWIFWQLVRTRKVYDNEQTQQFRRMIEDAEKGVGK